MGDLEIFCNSGIEQETARIDNVFDWKIVADPVSLQSNLYWVCGKSNEGVYSENLHDASGKLIYYREIDTDSINFTDCENYEEIERLSRGFRGGQVRIAQKVLGPVVDD